MANPGDKVRIHYTGRFEDGTVFDTSRGREPLEFVAGLEQVITGIDSAVLSMSEGDEATVTVPPEDAYGESRPELAREVERSMLPPDVGEGDAVRANVGGQDVVMWVRDVTDDAAVVDANHPLAGRTLVFDVEVVAVHPAA
jgi:peptidylprolyl isomerase